MATPKLDFSDAQTLVDACVHCGLCLSACPTYSLYATEPESPRGRIVMIAGALASGGGFTTSAAAHMQSCLGCMACVDACPAGVKLDDLLIGSRPASAARQRAGQSPTQRLAAASTRRTITNRKLMRNMAASLRIAAQLPTKQLPSSLRTVGELLPAPPRHRSSALERDGRLAPQGTLRGRVGLLLGCVSRSFLPAVHDAVANLLSAEGYEVLAIDAPCCGAIEQHAGSPRHAREQAQATIDAVAAIGGVEYVITDAGLCGAQLKNYGVLLGTAQARAFADLSRDACELLAAEPRRSPRGPVELRVAYFPDCQLDHVQRQSGPVRRLLSEVPGLEVVELAPHDRQCCGGVGLYAAGEPDTAAQLGERQAQALLDTGAQMILATSFGCVAQLQRHTAALGKPLPVVHPVQLLARSLQLAG